MRELPRFAHGDDRARCSIRLEDLRGNFLRQDLEEQHAFILADLFDPLNDLRIIERRGHLIFFDVCVSKLYFDIHKNRLRRVPLNRAHTNVSFDCKTANQNHRLGTLHGNLHKNNFRANRERRGNVLW